KVRTAIQAAAVRGAAQKLQEKYDDEILHFAKILASDPAKVLTELQRTAPRLRWVIAQWEELERQLDKHGTWYGAYRHQATLFQGYRSTAEDLYFSEQAWRTWLDCFATRPNLGPQEVEVISLPQVVPKAVQERGEVFWPPDPEASRARLRAIVDRELP